MLPQARPAPEDVWAPPAPPAPRAPRAPRGASAAAGRTVKRMSNTREDAHHLVDAVPDDVVPAVIEWLRQLTEGGRPLARRRFQSLGAGEAESDLAERSAEILRRELGEGKKSA